MITKLEFDMSSPEDRDSLHNALKADSMADKIETLYDEVFRPYIKYEKPLHEGTHSLSQDDHLTIKAIWQKVYEHFKEEE